MPLKVYHTPTDIQACKLAVMVANPPDDPMQARGHVSIAWPLDLLCTTDGQQQVVGFLMPQVAGMRPLFAYYNPLTRRQQCPLFTYGYLLRTARNLAAAMRALHTRGYVIGDVNESNILVTDTALVTLVDTDSFQVPASQNGTVYRCPVGKPEFTPPELQNRPFADVDRAPEHDLCGLAVLLFQLLMEGTHPFAGVLQGQGEPPPYEVRIAAGHFPYSRQHHGPYRPIPSAPPADMLHPTLQTLFLRCFELGHAHPQQRPDAEAWQQALQEAENDLVACTVNAQHLYGKHRATCPCSRAASSTTIDVWKTLWTAAWGVPWGVVWGLVWGVCRLPASGTASRRLSRVRRMLTGALLGAVLGIVASWLVGVTPGHIPDLYYSPLWDVVTRAQQHLPLPALLAALRDSLSSARPQLLSGAVVGLLLGSLWGACRR